MRIPTDGSTEREMDEVRSRLAAARSSLTVSEDTVRRTQITQIMSRAQDTVDLLLRQLEDMIDANLDELIEFFDRTDLTDEEKIAAVKMSFTHAEAMTYESEALNNFYLCRYAVAYAFEYAMLYDLALRLCLESGNTTFGAVSFGAGSFLDAWAMAYAKARLTTEDPAFDDIKLYYKGVDEQIWDTYFVNPTRVYSGEGSTLTPADNPIDEQIDDLFSKVWLYHRDVSQFLRDDMNGRFYYNALVFPKIINELRPMDIRKMVKALSELEFPYDEYYLLVSHSGFQMDNSIDILQQFIDAINSDGTFDVSCDCHDLLSPESCNAFASAWLGRDSLVPCTGEDDLPFQCYRFGSAVAEDETGTWKPDTYIDRHNRDFSYDAPKQFLSELGSCTGLVANQVVSVKHMVIDIIRLKRRGS